MINRVLYSLIVIILIMSCSKIEKQELYYKIITPKTDWTYYSDSQITFSTNLNSNDIHWYSNKDGYLGNGNSFTLNLTPGVHNIKAKLQSYEQNVLIYVNGRNIQNGQTLKYRISSDRSIFLPIGVFNFSFVALDGSVSQLSQIKKDNNIELKKDIHISTSTNSKNTIQQTKRNLTTQKYRMNEEKKLYVVNTKQPNLTPHEILAQVIKTSENCNIWYPVNPEQYSVPKIDTNDLNYCIAEIEKRIIPRLRILWGDLPDIDKDGKISIFFTPTINEEQTAIGFFNPEDFYKCNEFTPFSNEMDILYIAVPEQNKFSYSINCINATITHELTHAINYYIKTYSQILQNKSSIPNEETFLDEALSHLSESLCGYGISGGNVEILSFYLNNLGKYSAFKKDYLGNEDSNGRRGATSMFLSWLFWKKGGISWDINDPLTIIDKGGIQFIQQLVRSPECGWENIGKVYGENTDTLYIQMVEELNALRENVKPSVLDPYSKEPVQIFPDFQTYSIDNYEKKWTLSIPSVEFSDFESLIPYSFVLFNPYNNESTFTLHNSKITGQALGLFCLQ